MRHPQPNKADSHPSGIHAEARGLLSRKAADRRFCLERFEPESPLSDLILHYWLVRWDLTKDDDHVQKTLPHPSVHLVVDPQQGSAVHGVVRHRFEYRLRGKGAVFGVKFRPGAFSAFYSAPLQTLTDRSLPLSEFWGTTETGWEQQLLGERPEELVGPMNRKLQSLSPELPQAARQAGEIVATIETDPTLLTTEQVARRAGLSVRSLQRLFQCHIGVGPKWVINRYRMIDAVEALNRGDTTDLTDLAHRLGYFDQAHFTRAFTELTGQPPSRAGGTNAQDT